MLWIRVPLLLLVLAALASDPLDDEANDWAYRCSAALERVGEQLDLEGQTPRAAVTSSVGSTVQVRLRAGPDMGPAVLDASAVLWDHDVEQTDGWIGSGPETTPMSLVRNTGRVGLTLSGGAAHPTEIRQHFEVLARPALETCAQLQPGGQGAGVVVTVDLPAARLGVGQHLPLEIEVKGDLGAEALPPAVGRGLQLALSRRSSQTTIVNFVASKTVTSLYCITAVEEGTWLLEVEAPPGSDPVAPRSITVVGEDEAPPVVPSECERATSGVYQPRDYAPEEARRRLAELAPGVRSSRGRRVTTIIALDVSGSMGNSEHLAGAIAAARQVVEARSGERLGLVVFGGEAKVSVRPSARHRELLRVLETPNFGGVDTRATNVGAALAVSAQQLSRRRGDRSVLLIADGPSNTGAPPWEVADVVAALGIRIDVLGWAEPVPTRTGPVPTRLGALEYVAVRTGGEYFGASDAAGLVSGVERLLGTP